MRDNLEIHCFVRYIDGRKDILETSKIELIRTYLVKKEKKKSRCQLREQLSDKTNRPNIKAGVLRCIYMDHRFFGGN